MYLDLLKDSYKHCYKLFAEQSTHKVRYHFLPDVLLVRGIDSLSILTFLLKASVKRTDLSNCLSYCPQRRSTTISGVVHTRFHFPNTLHICRTVTLSLRCCTNTVIEFLSPVFTFLLTFTS